jgi:multidrug efflux system membrane fusion protein
MKPAPTEEREKPTSPEAPRVFPGGAQHPGHPATPVRRRRAHWGWIVLVLGLVGLGFTYWYNHRPQAGMTGVMGGRKGGYHRFAFGGGMGQAMPVVAGPAKAVDLPIYLNGLGTVTPVAAATVRTQISGQLRQVVFKEGQEVKQGDLLAVIDDRPYQVALEQAHGQLQQAQSQLQQAKSDLARYEKLAKEDSIAEQQVDAQKALVSQYQGLTNTAQAAIDTAQLNIRYCHITAPFAGRLGLRMVDPGNYVTPGDANGLVVLTEVQPISVIFTLPEDNVEAVSKRLHSGEKIPVYAYDRNLTRLLATGTLSTIDNEIDTTTGTVRLRAVFANADESLFPNEFVNARMLLDVRKGAIVVPTSAIERGENGPFVYVVQADNTVTARDVTLGPAEGENQSILAGIAVGERVVSDGADKLKEGMAVVVQQPGQNPAAEPAAARGGAKGEVGAWKKKRRSAAVGGAKQGSD